MLTAVSLDQNHIIVNFFDTAFQGIPNNALWDTLKHVLLKMCSGNDDIIRTDSKWIC